MSSPAEIPHADEALKTLVARFKADPGSSAFHELASALLARGHASEALRIAEHGLQKVPNQVEGRVERAAALLALGRPRVAYVELRRALAIDPSHRRGMRLLGKAYRDAGAPARAAALLAKRSMDPDYEQPPPPPPLPPKPTKKKPAPATPGESWKKRPAIEDDTKKSSAAGGAIPQDLFSDLTADLGLGAAVPETPMRRVEVTQIIRRKGLLRPPRSASELAEIDGPIVDTTQPGQLSELDEEPQEVTAREPAPLFSAGTGPSLAPFTLDDEPLFQEHLPFAVRPVESTADLEPTLDEDPVDAPTAEIHPTDSAGDTLVEHLDEGTEELEELEAKPPPEPLSPPSRAADTKIRRFVAEKSERTEPEAPVHSAPVVEKRAAPQQKLEIVDPQPSTARIAMAVGVGIVMLAYFVGLGWFLADDMAPWYRKPSVEAARGPNTPPADVPAKTARAP